MKAGIKVKFWGVRGSIPTPGIKYVKYGGNTSCVELLLPDEQLFIFDAGTGIRELGNSFCNREKQLKAHIFLSHFHWDHIQGLPFFMPSYIKGNEIVILGMETQEVKLDKILSNQMESIYSPVKLQSLSADIKFHVLSEGNAVIDGVNIATVFINHPGQSMGYVVTYGKTKICYFTDNEILPAWVTEDNKLKYRLDCRDKILYLTKGADLLIHDAQYTDEEYKSRVGWGHSSICEVLRLAKDAKINRVALFHHDPDHSDDQINILMANCKEQLDESYHSIDCFAAHEGMELHF